MAAIGVHASSNEVTQVAVGEDVGGTSIKFGFQDLNKESMPGFQDGDPIRQLPSRVEDGPEATIEQIEMNIERDGAPFDLKAIGLSVAGFANPQGHIHSSANYGERWDVGKWWKSILEFPRHFLMMPQRRCTLSMND